ncbi:Ribosome association toxin RatA [Pseudovibrio sp. W64]|jgi:coenzyme Q-binding protein COQ10|uniref:Coenzyme Q-binding protein COQ10 n=1 Tax=Pseudovibrio ascidiaceicola TaxID=285279 RepID=A0A1I4CXB5_9HYPH|nr:MULTISPECIES: type II toxin-antitoxin system RatA family toxin [Pseudovibrio]KZK80336.1 Ribosome association toxin RatA [Pseudovibrio sp. W64]KZK83251.1 Ribosome association toxin RatA [Pseudovibrio sp. Ad13]KZK98561.1 Ribosome association toxin RatA [Pseudovibrio sp. W74]KZL08407.1 Ribosome association toxin RatA [Pseudovibrio sp. Ad14]KZL10603.1 Ribosome association toxin RatA [Pseudovibrio sp. Ad26]
MPSFESTHRVQHSADDMFDLVADVEQYPQFVPLCQALRVRGRRKIDDHREMMVADMTVAYKVFKETFASRVTLDREASKITVEYLDGPFRHLENVWSFDPVSEKECDVSFYINYEFKSRTLGTMMGAMFDRAFRKFSSAFEDRADKIYGT